MPEAKNDQSSVGAEDALPIKQTSPTVYIVAGVGVLIVLGLVFGMSGGDDDSQKAKANASEKAADAAQGLTKEQLKEREEHLKRTQAALIAAAHDDAAAANKAQADEEKKRVAAAPEPEASAPKSASTSGSAPKKAVDKKKTMNSLDGLGSDITSALK